jgi:hypothetical protein
MFSSPLKGEKNIENGEIKKNIILKFQHHPPLTGTTPQSIPDISPLGVPARIEWLFWAVWPGIPDGT